MDRNGRWTSGRNSVPKFMTVLRFLKLILHLYNTSANSFLKKKDKLKIREKEKKHIFLNSVNFVNSMNSAHFVRSFCKFCAFCVLCEFCTLILHILYANSVRFVHISVCEFCVRILCALLCTNSVCKFCVQILCANSVHSDF